MSTLNRENRRVKRIRLTAPLRVVMGSIGANIRYDLTTRDVSHTGFFLDFEHPSRFPFTPSSIMEVWLQLEPQITIFFNGKMARVVHPGDPREAETGPGIAIRIVQIDKDNEKHLRSFLEQYGASFESVPTLATSATVQQPTPSNTVQPIDVLAAPPIKKGEVA